MQAQQSNISTFIETNHACKGPSNPFQHDGKHPHSRRHWTVSTVLLLILVGVGTLCMSSCFGPLDQSNAQNVTLPTQTFSMSSTPTLVIQGGAGTINIHSSSSNSVIVQATKHVSGSNANLNDITENATQNGSTITITTTKSDNTHFIGNLDSVDLDITVPTTVNGQIDVQAGTVTINGTIGQISVRTQAGSVTMDSVTLKGQSRVDTQAGSITFNGTLDPQSNDLFNTQVGHIDVTLPSNASFTLKTSVDVGKVTNDFGSNSVGSSPQTQLEIDTQAGAISLHKR